MHVDVVDARLFDVERAGLAVLVEPLYGCVAVAAALDAGWVEVELADRSDAPVVPLVSFEQSPEPGQVRCRVRAGDLVRDATDGMLLGAPSLARPLASRIAMAAPERVTFVASASGDDRQFAADAWWACGMLVRVLLEELDVPSQLTDAAGVAVTLAQGSEDVAAQLSIGVRWARHLADGGHADDLRVAAAVDSLGVVPQVELEDGVLVARPWAGVASPGDHSGS